MQVLEIRTSQREQFYEITREIKGIVKDNGLRNALMSVYCPHTTAGITINEAADPSVPIDILTQLSKVVPHKGDYQHLEGNSDAHIKSSLIGCSQQIILQNGSLVLGTWQGVFFTEFDGPRTRKVYVQWVLT